MQRVAVGQETRLFMNIHEQKRKMKIQIKNIQGFEIIEENDADRALLRQWSSRDQKPVVMGGSFLHGEIKSMVVLFQVDNNQKEGEGR